MLSRKVSYKYNQDISIPNEFLDCLPTNKQIKNFVISHISPLKSRLKTHSVNDLSLNNDLISISDLQQIYQAEKQQNLQLISHNKAEYNNQLDILNSLKHHRKISQNQIALPKIEQRKSSRIIYLEAYSDEKKMYQGKQKQKRSVSLSKNREKTQQNENQIDLSKRGSIQNGISNTELENLQDQIQQKSIKITNLKTLSPKIQKKTSNQEEFQEQLKKQVKFVKRKQELDGQISEQVELLQRKLEQEKDIEKILFDTYEKENKDNEERKLKIQQQNKKTSDAIRQQIQEKALKNKEQFEKQKLENNQISQSKQEEDKKNNLILIQKKKDLQNHYKELAKQILIKQKSNQQSEVTLNKLKEQSFNERICSQDQYRIQNRQENSKSIQGFLKKQQRDLKEHMFLEYKNMYDI
ncbi:hypothetical protein ABPG72_019426 [Tetrahymena utriculariae]